MERYSSLFRLPEKLYTLGSPLLIAAGALLKDNQTGNILAQIKFRSLSNKEIKAVKVNIKAFDISGAEMQGVDGYQYLDLSAARNAEFGQKTAVTLPDSVTRSFSVVCTSVIFSDNSVWEAEENAVWEPLPKQQNLENLIGNLAQQYRRDTSVQSHFEPLEYSDLWICSCGAVNRRGESQCCSCAVSRNTIFSALNTGLLTQDQAMFEQKEQARKIEEACQKALREKENRRHLAKIKKLAIIFSGCILFIAVIVILSIQLFIPMYQYHSALSIMEGGQYDKAIEAFEKLGEFKDSQEQIKEANYRKGSELLEQERFSDAAPIFASIEGYKDSEEKLEISQKELPYREALSFIDQKDNLEKAYHTLIELGDYKDSEKYLSKFSVVLSSIDIGDDYHQVPVQFTYSSTGKIQSITIGNDTKSIYELDENLLPKSVLYTNFKEDDTFSKNDKITYNEQDITYATQMQQQRKYKDHLWTVTSTAIYELNNQQIQSYQYQANQVREDGYTLQYEDTGVIEYVYDSDHKTVMRIEGISNSIEFNYQYIYDEKEMNTYELPLFAFYFIQFPI